MTRRFPPFPPQNGDENQKKIRERRWAIAMTVLRILPWVGLVVIFLLLTQLYN